MQSQGWPTHHLSTSYRAYTMDLLSHSYDGEVVEEYQKSLATYFITDTTTTVSATYHHCFNLGYTVLFLVIHSCYLQAPAESSTKCLRADWIWDSLKQKHQLPIESYLVSQTKDDMKLYQLLEFQKFLTTGFVIVCVTAVASFTVYISAVLYAITMHMIQKMMHKTNATTCTK